MFCCRSASQKFVQFANCSVRSTIQHGRHKTIPVNSSFVRTFRLFPAAGGSIRSRMSQINSQGSQSNSAALDLGRIGLAAAGLVGLGGLCYYGLSLGSAKSAAGMSALDRSMMWPDYVRQRIASTYAYLAGGAAIAAGTAVSLSRSPAFCRMMVGSGWVAPILMLVGSMATGVACQMMPYPADGGLSAKHLVWAVYSSSIGAMLMPVCLLGGPLLTRAALYTGGIVGGLSLVAVSAPSEKFLNWGGPLAIGLGVVVVSSIGSMFMSPVSRLGSGMAAVSIYGGLLLFSGFLLYDTQLVIKRAEATPVLPPPVWGMQQPRPFDPINNSIHILLDTVNIFVRIVSILAGGGSRRK